MNQNTLPPRRMIVDSNFLSDSELELYLAERRSNYIVIIDYLMMEIYKHANAYNSLIQSTSIICKRPDQVIILKGTTAIGALNGKLKSLTTRMISNSNVRDFRNFCKIRKRVELGELSIDDAVSGHSDAAKAHMQRVLSDASDILESFKDIARSHFSNADLRKLRSEGVYTDGLIASICKLTIQLGLIFLAAHPHGRKPVPRHELPNVYHFRFALCAVLLIVRWMESGEPANTKPVKTLNDLVDLHFAAYATYFDGLLSKDKRTQSLYEEAKFILSTCKL